VQFADEPLSWKEAVRRVGQPMVDQGLVTVDYVEASIAGAEANGPFYDLGKGIAMPHARPEQGAKAVGVSLLRCKTPVLLLDREDHPIDIFLMLSATDANAHLEMLQRIAAVLVDDVRVAELKAAGTPEEVISVFNWGEDGPNN
jgi:PTS system ascorbate-specific IIA component